jgi:hypothetical protein
MRLRPATWLERRENHPMTLTLQLTPEEEAVLLEKAADAGMDPAGYVLSMIDLAPKDGQDQLPRTPAEASAYWEREGVYGLFKDGPDSPELSRDLRRKAENRGAR